MNQDSKKPAPGEKLLEASRHFSLYLRIPILTGTRTDLQTESFRRLAVV